MQGPPLGGSPVDCGAMVMPGAAAAVQSLVTDAVSRGAKVTLKQDLDIILNCRILINIKDLCVQNPVGKLM